MHDKIAGSRNRARRRPNDFKGATGTKIAETTTMSPTHRPLLELLEQEIDTIEAELPQGNRRERAALHMARRWARAKALLNQQLRGEITEHEMYCYLVKLAVMGDV